MLKRYIWNVFAEGISVECCEGSCATRRKMSECRLWRCWLVHTRVVVVVDHIVLYCIVSYLLAMVGCRVQCAVCQARWRGSRIGGGGFHYNYIYINYNY